MKEFLFLFFIYLHCVHSYTNYLTPLQWKNINHLIQNDKTTVDQRRLLNNVIYKKYHEWALHKAQDFKQFHHYKCRHIPIEELELYAICGLMRSIKKYDGRGKESFLKYSSMYISGELYTGVTKLQPICGVSTTERKRRKNTPNHTDEYNIRMESLFVGGDEWKLENLIAADKCGYGSEWLLECIFKHEYSEFWKTSISKLSPFEQQIYKYKYDMYLNQIRSHREIGEMMGYSEEWIRQLFRNSLAKLDIDK
jgi:DNA-directed RNA polymerase specialized sigma subunit